MIRPKFEILIATRNRPRKLKNLLQSISKSSLKPEKVIVVSSGDDISACISEFSEQLKMEHIHSELSGQVNQKKQGIEKLMKSSEWVIFLDDDLLINSDTVANAFGSIEELDMSNSELLGIGLGLPPTQRLNRSSIIESMFARFFCLTNSEPGSVLPSGQGVSYLHSPEPIFTSWLNGASVWRIEAANDYLYSVPSSMYAACEDLVFSYQQSKKGKLVYVPSAEVEFQDAEPNDYNRDQAIKSAAAWRYFFVKSNPELSLTKLFISQVGRLVFIVVKNHKNLKALIAGFVTLKWLAMSILTNREPEYLMRRYL
jgi:glycosyltransferase involved in cell wall biosynthesis